jgi:hypothetical protein
VQDLAKETHMACVRIALIGMILVAAPTAVQGQGEFERYGSTAFVRFDDGMVSGEYVFVMSEGGVVSSVDEKGIVFLQRDPALVWACIGGDIRVVYRYDAFLLGQGGRIQVRYRIGDNPVSPVENWAMVVYGGSDPGDDVFGGVASSAAVPPEAARLIEEAAGSGARVMLRATDPVDGETLTDVFTLDGLADALDRLRGACGRE